MKTFLKMLFAAIAAFALPSLAHADGEGEMTLVSVDDSAPVLRADASLPDVSDTYNRLDIIAGCVLAPDGTGATSITESGASGLSQFTYSRLDWDKRSMSHERGETHSFACLGIVHISVDLFVDNPTEIFSADAKHFFDKQVMDDGIMPFAWTYGTSALYMFKMEKNK